LSKVFPIYLASRQIPLIKHPNGRIGFASAGREAKRIPNEDNKNNAFFILLKLMTRITTGIF
jgi:hypothetical protein